jgi:hypothetical protein
VKPQELKLAIDHPEYGPEMRKTRILTPDEREAHLRLARIRSKMEEAKALDPETDAGRKNRAKLELATSDLSVLFKLELSWLSEDERFVLGTWTATKDLKTHDEATLICKFVIETYRPDLRGYKIAVVMQKDVPPANGRGRLGTATRLPRKIHFISTVHAIVTVDFGEWCMLTDQDRQRLIHHELEHLHQNDDRNGLVLLGHDFEDFISVIQLYGLRSESERFSTDGQCAEVLEQWSAQLELLQAG